jgi:serine/threonine protein kinase
VIEPLPQPDSSVGQRFWREAHTIARLGSKHVIDILDIGYTDGVGFVVMEWVEGESLAELLERARARETRDSLRLPRADREP